METINAYKSFSRDISNEELLLITHKWKVELEFLEHELHFLKHLLNSSIYEKDTMNLFETLQLYIEEIDNHDKERLILFDKILFYHNQLINKIECDNVSYDRFYLQLHAKMTHNYDAFLKETKSLKLELFEYLQSVILV
jgi:hypothetical protein